MPFCATCQVERPLEELRTDEVSHVRGWLRLRCESCVSYSAGLVDTAQPFELQAWERRRHVALCSRCQVLTSFPAALGGVVETCPDYRPTPTLEREP